jgi:hypothetical protein
MVAGNQLQQGDRNLGGAQIAAGQSSDVPAVNLYGRFNTGCCIVALQAQLEKFMLDILFIACYIESAFIKGHPEYFQLVFWLRGGRHAGCDDLRCS